MMIWTMDELRGAAEQVKGLVKEKAGQVTGYKCLQEDGTVDRLEGKLRARAARPSDTCSRPPGCSGRL